MSAVQTTSLSRTGVFALVVLLAACGTKKTGGTAGKTPDKPTTNDNPSQILAAGPYEIVWPGAYYGTNDGFMRHVVAGRNINYVANVALGNLDAITTFQSEKANAKGDDQTVKAVYTGNDAIIDSVTVSPGVPERALFLKNSSGADGSVVGDLFLADLSQWPPAVKALPGHTGPAANVPVGGYFYGKGSEILFVEQVPPTGGTGLLDWSDGTANVNIGAGSLPGLVIMSGDHSRALALTGLVLNGNEGAGQGDLNVINMSTGKATKVDTGVAGRASGYTPTGGVCDVDGVKPADCVLKSAFDKAYSMSADGRVVAYAKNGQVNIAVVDYAGTAPAVSVKPSLGAGRFPGVSPSGKRLAYFDTTSGALQVYDITDPAHPVLVTSAAAAGYLCPQFTPDDQFAAYLEKLSVRGNNAEFGNDLGTLRLVAATNSAAPVTYAENVLWHSLSFWPNDPTKTTVQLSVMGNTHDALNPQVFTATGAVGDLLVDAPATLRPSGRTRASAPVAQSVNPSNFALLPASGGFGILTSPSVSAMATPNADIWLPASPVVRATPRAWPSS
jgi:hypothetical protein